LKTHPRAVVGLMWTVKVIRLNMAVKSAVNLVQNKSLFPPIACDF